MNAIRASPQPAATSRRIVALFLASLALIVGLLAMHSVTTAHAASPAQSHTSLAAVAEAPAAEHDVATVPCSGSCAAPDGDAEHSMLLMACLLALIVATILVVAPRLLTRSGARPLPLAISSAAPTAAPTSRPPSLIELSISRT